MDITGNLLLATIRFEMVIRVFTSFNSATKRHSIKRNEITHRFCLFFFHVNNV